jgi:hypothetical protein
LDIDKDGINVERYLKAVVGEPRVAYVIWNKRIWTHAAGWQPYSGANPHTHHIHVSIRHTKAAENGSAWSLGDVKPASGGKPISKVPGPSKDVQKKLKGMGFKKQGTAEVKQFQKQHGLVQDGKWGKITEAQYVHNVKLQDALKRMKGVQKTWKSDGYIGATSNTWKNYTIKRQRWTRNNLVANLKKVGAWK